MIHVTNPKLEGRIVLVGPTGVGKTTTIAKLAGRLALVEKRKVGLNYCRYLQNWCSRAA